MNMFAKKAATAATAAVLLGVGVPLLPGMAGAAFACATGESTTPNEPTPTATATAKPTPTATATAEPSVSASRPPTTKPSPSTTAPGATPTVAPTQSPTATPTVAPTQNSTATPTQSPTKAPSAEATTPPEEAAPSSAPDHPVRPAAKGAAAPLSAASATTAVDWSKVSVSLSGVPTRIERDREMRARIVVVNGTGVQVGRIPVVLAIDVNGSFGSEPGDTPDTMTEHRARPSDMRVTYAYAGGARVGARIETACQATYSSSIVVSGRGAPGTTTTIDIGFTVKSSAPVNTTEGWLSAGIGVPGGKSGALSKFAIGPRTTKGTAKPAAVETTSAAAGDSSTTAGGTPAGSALALTGSMSVPLSITGGVSALVGAGLLVATGRRRRAVA